MSLQGQYKEDDSRRFLLAVTVTFVLINTVLLIFSGPTKQLIEADSLTLYRMAMQFLKGGVFLEEQRQPLYPLVMAAVFWIFNPDNFTALIILQAGLLYITGVVIWYVARVWIPGAAHWIFALTVLNPNALGNVHMPLADSLFSVLITISVWCVLKFAISGKLRFIVTTGVALGLAILTRPEAKFLIYILPLAAPVIAAVSGRIRQAPVAILAALFAVVVVWLIALPWAMHNQSAGFGLVLNSGEKAADNARGHFALIEADRQQRKQQQIIQDLYEQEKDLLDVAGLKNSTVSQTRNFLFGHYISRIFTSDPVILFKLYSKAWVAQFVSGGAQTLNTVLGIDISTQDKLMNRNDWLRSFADGLKGQSTVGAIITIVCIGFALVLRAAGLVGIVVMVLRRHWPLLIVILALVGFKALIHLFYGLSRYRLPVEPLLMILAVYGFDGLRAALPRK
jgi:4-amino-4-deoxy-L-arabinose transferase-like glycosyltransferase